MKINLVQLNPTIGDFDYNVDLILDACNSAESEGADIIVFSELVTCGYYPQDLLLDPDFLTANRHALDRIKAATKDTDLYIVLGTLRKNHGFGKPLFNSLMVLYRGQTYAEYHKQLLPTYNIFDERRHFEPGQTDPCILEIKGYRIAFLICEDTWNDNVQNYAANPIRAVVEAQIDLLITVNASPSNVGKNINRKELMSAICVKYNVSILYVNCVGGQDSLIFDGASFAMNSNGRVAYEAPSFKTHQETIEFNGNFKVHECVQELHKYEFYRLQLELGLYDYTRRCNFKQALVGCSGGIDSALTLALATETLGAENVIAVAMPSVFSSFGSVEDSKTLCLNLGIKLYIHPIQEMVDQYTAQYFATFSKPLVGTPLENLQARIRGTILMEYSNDFGALLLTTGNKSEVSVGYCTLYGDTNGGLSLIGDMYKTEVFELSRWINKRLGKDIIPNNIIVKEPSAELAEDQKDSNSLPPYTILDPMLKILIEGDHLSESDRLEIANHPEIWSPDGKIMMCGIKKMVDRNEYKRRQSPPILRVRPRSFGFGRQMPLTAKYNNEKINDRRFCKEG